MKAKQTLVKNGRYHVATFRKSRKIISCEIGNTILTYPGSDFSKALGCFEYLHPLMFIESSSIRKKYPETANLSISEVCTFLNALPKHRDPFPSIYEVLN